MIDEIDKISMHSNICAELNDIYRRKNHDYGDSFHTTFLEEGMAMSRIRLSDKLSRFKKLSKSSDGAMVDDESIRDTLLDLANYAIMTVIEMDISSCEEKAMKNMNPENFTSIRTDPTIHYTTTL